jgi:hypothetical protein
MALHAFAGNSSAISPEAATARKTVGEVMRSAEHSEALFGRKAISLSQLTELAVQHSQPGWDGADASTIDPTARSRADAFVRAIPEYLPLPEFAPDPDGAISLDWVSGRGRSLSIRIGPENRVAFAWLDGSDTGHGAVFFDGEQIPIRILYELGQIAENAATVRTA